MTHKLAKELAIELDDLVTRDCVKSTPYTRGHIVVVVRLLEQAIRRAGA